MSNQTMKTLNRVNSDLLKQINNSKYQHLVSNIVLKKFPLYKERESLLIIQILINSSYHLYIVQFSKKIPPNDK